MDLLAKFSRFPFKINGFPFKILFKSMDFLSNHWISFPCVLSLLPESMDFLLTSIQVLSNINAFKHQWYSFQNPSKILANSCQILMISNGLLFGAARFQRFQKDFLWSCQILTISKGFPFGAARFPCGGVSLYWEGRK